MERKNGLRKKDKDAFIRSNSQNLLAKNINRQPNTPVQVSHVNPDGNFRFSYKKVELSQGPTSTAPSNTFLRAQPPTQ
jgi:hypothetical protein